jgi:hypothetical protein
MLAGLSNITDFFSKPIRKITFKDLQLALSSPDYIVINTLLITEQDCLIKNTLRHDLEEKTVNDLLNGYDLGAKKFIVYGKNSLDETAEKKYQQLMTLGFAQVYLYSGGLFEWMLLQDIYGADEFPTTKKVLDILKYSGPPTFYR